ncbi:hypothetical protein KRR38_17160 [Novosphingobium sp. G106]|uniref:hypothetical protein n=1 Tax=Novosphingobium sp. G106 TaxID=2849500 RepID=UPI001C2DA32B|nr:hypothetical protein [Novosphingobium sp. G106]MBV1689353.1 hypothetical protein [Novosphingobium sp. G106]
MADFFFLLPGYVMARTFEERMKDDLTAVGFVIVRFRGLWPPAAAGYLIGAATLLGTLGTSFIAAIMIPAILLVPIPTRLGTFPLNAPAWSINFEILANAGHALFLYKVPTRCWRLFPRSASSPGRFGHRLSELSRSAICASSLRTRSG